MVISNITAETNNKYVFCKYNFLTWHCSDDLKIIVPMERFVEVFDTGRRSLTMMKPGSM